MNPLRKPFLLLSLWLNPWRSRNALARMQGRKLRRLLRYARKNFPYYRERLRAAGIAPGDIRSPGDLRALPVSGKEDLRRAIRDLPGARGDVRWLSTSGSTGMPMRFPFLARETARLNLSWLRPMAAHRVRPWHSRLEITGPHNIRRQDRWYQRLGLFRLTQLSVFAGEEQWLEELNRSRPDILWGYSRSLIAFARFLAGRPAGHHRPRWIFGVSELVDEPGREAVRRAFGRELIDLYGAVETGCIAWQCPACGDYHVNSDALIVEFIPGRAGDPEGAPESIVVTNLHSYAFPIIRYAIGDAGRPSGRRPACGRSLPLMKIIAGREDDAVALPSGRELSPLYFFAVMKKIPGLLFWRVTQEESQGLRVSIVPEPGGAYSAAGAEAVIRGCIPEPIDIVLETVTAIPPDPSGKQRSVIVSGARPARGWETGPPAGITSPGGS